MLPSATRRLVALLGCAALAVGVLLAPTPVSASPASPVVSGVPEAAAAGARTAYDQVERRRQGTRFDRWAPAGRARVTPGVMMVTRGAQCTANFVFTDARRNVYVGYAAHCAGRGAATQTNGCRVGSQPLGTRVAFVEGGNLASGGTRVGVGRLAYSSWRTMRRIGTTRPAVCAHNDFALVKVRRAQRRRVNPSVPFWGGPTGIDRNGTNVGDRLYSYGNSSLRADLDVLSPKVGFSLGDTGGGWGHRAYTVTPGIPGDSGSGVMSGRGRAVGTVSTVAVAPFPASNGLGDLRRELRFARKHSGIRGLRLAEGTEPFRALP